MAPAPVTVMPAPPASRTDKVTYLLLGATVFFALILVAIDKLFPNEGQVFQVIANLTSGFAGAFFTRIQPVGATHPGSPAPAPVIPFPAPNAAPTTPAAAPDTAAAALAAAMAPTGPSGKP